jgi:hypothetical protein
MPAIAEKYELDPSKFKGALRPAVVRFVRDNTYFYRQLIPDSKAYRTRAIKGANSLQEAIDQAHLAFLEIRQLPQKKKPRKCMYDSGFVDPRSWYDYSLPCGGIYIYTTDFDTVKIGKSSDFISRFRTHQCSNPESLKVLVLIEAVSGDVRDQLERQYHAACDKYRRLNEWFWYVPTIQNMVCDLQQEHDFTPFTFGKKPPGFD